MLNLHPRSRHGSGRALNRPGRTPSLQYRRPAPPHQQGAGEVLGDLTPSVNVFRASHALMGIQTRFVCQIEFHTQSDNSSPKEQQQNHRQHARNDPASRSPSDQTSLKPH